MSALLQNLENIARYRLLPFIAGIVFITLGHIVFTIGTYLLINPILSMTLLSFMIGVCNIILSLKPGQPKRRTTAQKDWNE